MQQTSIMTDKPRKAPRKSKKEIDADHLVDLLLRGFPMRLLASGVWTICGGAIPDELAAAGRRRVRCREIDKGVFKAEAAING